MIRLTCFAGRSVGVFGLGGSGRAAARALVDGGAQVFAWDDNERARALSEREGVAVCDLREFDWSRLDALVLAPGVPLTHPQPHWSVVRAKDAGVEIIGDVELFCRQRAFECPNSPFIAITGTNGKSTTTALVSHLLSSLGFMVEMGGNIGKAIVTLEPPSMSRVHVIEVSSYQIDLAPSLDPTVGVLLNLSPDHLDRHGDMENYARVKERLITGSHMKVVGIDDSWTRAVSARVGEGVHAYPFTIGEGAGVVPRLYAIGETLFSIERDGAVSTSLEVASLAGCAALRGAHNVQNALGALGAIKALQDWCKEHTGSLELGASSSSSSSGASSSSVSSGVCGKGAFFDAARLQAGLSSFAGLAHRLELVGEADGVSFVNDSKATNAISAMTALRAWRGGVYWIAGGLAKDGGIEELVGEFDRVKRAYLIGDAAKDFALTLEGRVEFVICDTLSVAVERAARDAGSGAGEDPANPPVVLLSPACASFDQFANFEARGAAFCALVAKLPGIKMSGRTP